MSLCDKCRVTDCLLELGGRACKSARRRDCPDVLLTNADKIRVMDDTQLTALLARLGADTDKLNAVAPQSDNRRFYNLLGWLQKPAEKL